MTPLSCSLVVRALVGPALVNDPLSCSFIARAFVGPAARLELDALGWSIRVSFDDRGASGFGWVNLLRLLVLFPLSDRLSRSLHC